MTFIKNSKLYFSDLREVCIKNDWCNSCINEQFDKLAELCQQNANFIDDAKLAKIALLIYEYTEFDRSLLEQYSKNEIIGNLLFTINKSITVSFEVQP